MLLEEQINKVFKQKNKQLSAEAVQLIINMDSSELSSLSDTSTLKMEAKLLLQMKSLIEKINNYHPEFPSLYDEYYIAISEDKNKTPIALVFPISRFIYEKNTYNSIEAIRADYSSHNLAFVDLECMGQVMNIPIFRINPPFNGRGMGGFMLKHLSAVITSINTFLDKYNLSEDRDIPDWLREEAQYKSRYKSITGYVSADTSIIPQEELKKFYLKHGYHLTDVPGFKIKNKPYSCRNYFLKEI